jgi:fatty-acyl-CoA synthase
MHINIKDNTLNEIIDTAATKYADREAIAYAEDRVTYRQLEERVNNLAKGFLELGINKGDNIGVWMTDNPHWIYSFFATAKVGATLVPVNPRFRAQDVQFVIKHSDIKLLILSDKSPEIVDYVGIMHEISPIILKSQNYHLTLPEFPLLKYLVTVGKNSHLGMLRIEDVMQSGSKRISDGLLLERQRLVMPEDLALLQYTSGTTANPRGCMVTHGSLVRNCIACSEHLQLEERDCFYDPMPPFHLLGICFGLIPTMLCGACRFGTDHFDPLETLKVIDNEKCIATSGFETMILAWLNHSEFSKFDTSSLRTGYLAASPELQRFIRSRLPHWKPLNIYGLSEISGNFCASRITDDDETRIRCNGMPHDGLSIKIIDPTTNQDLPPGESGEILCSGWTLMKGYYKDIESTKKTIDQNGWLHTGDQGMIDKKSGELIWIGRLKDVVKVGGENVAPAEVEGLLLQNPKTKLAQVVGVPDKELSEVVAAFVELKENETSNEEEIINFCRGKVASFKIPRYVRFVKEWPMSTTKIQKFKLKEQIIRELRLQ